MKVNIKVLLKRIYRIIVPKYEQRVMHADSVRDYEKIRANGWKVKQISPIMTHQIITVFLLVERRVKE